MTGRVTAVSAATAIVLLTGCGGGGTTKTVTAPASGASRATPAPSGVSKAAFIRQADRLCQDYRTRLSSTSREGQRLSQLPANEALTRAVPIYDRYRTEVVTLVRKLRALTPPKGDEGPVTRYLQGGDEVIARLDEIITAGRQQDASKFATLTASLRTRTEAIGGIAQGYGFKVCGTPA